MVSVNKKKKLRQATTARNGSELYGLFSAVAATIFSRGGQAYSFENFHACARQDESNQDVIRELRREYAEVCAQVEEERKRRYKLKQMMDFPIDTMNTEELLVLKATLEGVKEKIHKKRAEILANNYTT